MECPLNYKIAVTCKSCEYIGLKDGKLICNKYDYNVQKDHVCDSYKLDHEFSDETGK
jgi:hypothetical protein